MSRFEAERAKVDRNAASKRHISAHRLPVSLPLPRARPPSDAPAAAFLVQLMEPPRKVATITTPVSRDTLASQRYRSAETSDVKRVPMGYRKSVIA